MTPMKIGPCPEVGRGGVGVVYLGRDTRFDRRATIKVLPDALAQRLGATRLVGGRGSPEPIFMPAPAVPS